MCTWEHPVTLTFKCGHTAKDIPKSRLIWCPAAAERGSECSDQKTSSKGSSRSRAARFDCPDCVKKRNHGGGGGKDDSGDGGGAGTVSPLTGSKPGVKVY